MTAIYWMRRDLRLEDNRTLHASLKHGVVIPVFVFDPYLNKNTNARRLNFLHNSLQELDTNLQARGSRLIVRTGDSKVALANMVQESGANTPLSLFDK